MAGFISERVAGFNLECMAGFVGIRTMGNTKDPNEKQPGEKPPGKYHYNPGNMSGKEAEEESRDEAHDRERLHERRDQKG
jgi:hypothetical protein